MRHEPCRHEGRVAQVLILILMEYALRGKHLRRLETPLFCHNPYSNGICSARGWYGHLYRGQHDVLILILMEYALRV